MHSVKIISAPYKSVLNICIKKLNNYNSSHCVVYCGCGLLWGVLWRDDYQLPVAEADE